MEEIFEERSGFLTENCEAQLKIIGKNKFEEKPGSTTVLGLIYESIKRYFFYFNFLYAPSYPHTNYDTYLKDYN